MKRNNLIFALGAILILLAGFFAPSIVTNPFYFFAGYVIVQYIVIATGWNVLGGYAGYINFGAAAFFGSGVYLSAFLFNAFGLPLWVGIIGAAALGAILGLAMGYLTLQIQGVYFAIATLGLVIVLETIVHNLPGLGGARGMASDIEIQAREILRIRKRMNDLYVKYTGQSLTAIEKAMDRDTFLEAEEAMEFGIVDKVFETRPESEGGESEGSGGAPE